MLQGGDDWAAGPDGTYCQGHFRVAELLIMSPQHTMLTQYRADWTLFPLTWGAPDGVCDSHKIPEATALHETAEETGLLEHQLRIFDTQVTTGPFPVDSDRPELADGQKYHTVYALVAEELETNPNDESLELRWTLLDDVNSLNPLPFLVESWPRVRAHLEKLLEVLDQVSASHLPTRPLR